MTWLKTLLIGLTWLCLFPVVLIGTIIVAWLELRWDVRMAEHFRIENQKGE